MQLIRRSAPSVYASSNAVVEDGLKDLGNSVIYLCHIKIGRALVGCLEGFERRLEFRDTVG